MDYSPTASSTSSCPLILTSLKSCATWALRRSPGAGRCLRVRQKSQIQALDRIFPSRVELTHDYSHGTTTLFAALDVATGEVVHESCRATGIRSFCGSSEDRAQRGFRDIHDSCHPQAWPSGRGSTAAQLSASSANSTRQLKRLAVTSVDQLIEAINHYIDRRNDNPTPFVWTASAQSIIAKVSKAKETLATQH